MTQELTKIETESTDILNKANDIAIKDDKSNQCASLIVKAIKALKTSVKEEFRPGIENAHKTWKGLIAQEKKHYEPLEKADKILRAKINDFLNEQERIRIEEQKKIDEAAKKAEESEKAKLEKRAKKAEQQGDMDKADAIREQAETTFEAPAIAQPKVEKQEGISQVETWDFEVTDKFSIPEEYLVVDMVKIRKIVKALKSDTKIPGIKVFSKKSVSVR